MAHFAGMIALFHSPASLSPPFQTLGGEPKMPLKEAPLARLFEPEGRVGGRAPTEGRIFERSDGSLKRGREGKMNQDSRAKNQDNLIIFA